MSDPSVALAELAAQLRAEESVISAHVAEPAAEPALGRLAAAGPRTARAAGDYAVIVESVREGYLLHYGGPRIVVGADRDLRLLAGDYLYALGLDRLAGLGDLDAVRELSDLITLAAEIHDREGDPARLAREGRALWLACAVAIAAGPSPGHDAAKAALRAGTPDAAERLVETARAAAAAGGLDEALTATADAIDSTAQNPS
ncbi:MAG: hypothetical protein ACJ75R_00915 [Solirubrobacterales bacterium]